MKERILTGLGMLLLCQPVAMADKADPATVERLQSYLEQTTSLTAGFSQVVLDDSRQQIGSSEGQVFIKRPGKFRWEYQNPDPSLLLADGKKLWSYDELLEQAVVRDLADYRGANPTLLLGGDVQITDSFEIVSTYSTGSVSDDQEGEVQWLELSAKDDSSDFSTVRLGFFNDAIQLMELQDRLEQTTRILFSDVKINVEINDQKFSFVPPENVDVVGNIE